MTVSAVAKKLLADYKKCYDEYKILKKKLNSADSDESERLKEIDLLSYQVNELTESDVKQGEEQELESERTALMSFEKIFSLLNDAKMALDGDENYGGGLESVDSASELPFKKRHHIMLNMKKLQIRLQMHITI